MILIRSAITILIPLNTFESRHKCALAATEKGFRTYPNNLIHDTNRRWATAMPIIMTAGPNRRRDTTMPMAIVVPGRVCYTGVRPGMGRWSKGHPCTIRPGSLD